MKRKIEYKECIEVINRLRFNEESSLFAVERDKGLQSIIETYIKVLQDKIYTKALKKKAANFLYLIVKNHVFADGNKRIADNTIYIFLKLLWNFI